MLTLPEQHEGRAQGQDSKISVCLSKRERGQSDPSYLLEEGLLANDWLSFPAFGFKAPGSASNTFPPLESCHWGAFGEGLMKDIEAKFWTLSRCQGH